jgi:hypothetical protein
MSVSLEDKVYASVILLFEHYEAIGHYRGNAHHLAQGVSWRVAEALLPKQQRTIYDQLSTTPLKTGDIAQACGIASKNVSAQLMNIYKSTRLVQYKNQGKFKLWYKVNN